MYNAFAVDIILCLLWIVGLLQAYSLKSFMN